MESLTTPSLQSSSQLRLGLNCRRKCSLVHIRTTHVRVADRRIRMCSSAAAAGSADGGEKKKVKGVPESSSWENKETSGSDGDGFAGWVGLDSTGGGSPKKKKSKEELNGILVAGLAGSVLSAGLTLAYLSLSKRNNSGPKPHMESMTAQQEVLLASDNEIDKVDSENDMLMPDKGPQTDSTAERNTGINQDLSPEVSEATFESTHGDNISAETSLLQNDESASNAIDVVNNASSPGELQVKPNISDEPLPPDSSFNLPHIQDSDMVNGSNLKDPEVNQDDTVPTASIESKENLVPVSVSISSVTDTDLINLKLDHTEKISISSDIDNPNLPSKSYSGNHIDDESLASDNSVMVEVDAVASPNTESESTKKTETSFSITEDYDLSKTAQVPNEVFTSPPEEQILNENGSSGTTPTNVANTYSNEPDRTTEIDGSSSFFESLMPENSISPAGIPAPCLVSAALQIPPGKVVVPAVIDQVQSQALAALQVLKVIEADAHSADLCTRREYARWLVSSSSTLSKNSISKVYPAMYIENVTELAFDDVTPQDPDFVSIQGKKIRSHICITELAFDDVTPQDPDFVSIQGLAEAGLISSKLSKSDMLQSSDGENASVLFFPDSPLSRQDLVSWKMALDKRQLPEVDRKIMSERCAFIDIDKIDPDAWPALVADRSAGDQGIITLAFGYTRLFQPDKPVTKAQAAIALATGEAADIVNEELARIEAELMAETAVAAHTALVAEVEKDINANFEKELSMEREKIDAIEKMAQEARLELEKLRAEREEENNALARKRAAVESEMEVLSRLRRDLEEQLQSLMSNKVEISFEKEKINKLRKDAESENQAIVQLQYELEVERKALSMARAWAEDEAKRAREQAKALEEARDRWGRHGIKIVVDDDLREEANAGVTWQTAGKDSTVDQTVSRAERLVSKLKEMAEEIRGKSRVVIETVILKITSRISTLKEWAAETAKHAGEFKGSLAPKAGEFQGAVVSKASDSLQGLQRSTAGLSLAVKEGAKRIIEDCREGVEKISQKFKA